MIKNIGRIINDQNLERNPVFSTFILANRPRLQHRNPAIQDTISQIADKELKELEERVVSKIIEGTYVGTSIKRTPAYETNLVETEFYAIRETFWSNLYS